MNQGKEGRQYEAEDGPSGPSHEGLDPGFSRAIHGSPRFSRGRMYPAMNQGAMHGTLGSDYREIG